MREMKPASKKNQASGKGALPSSKSSAFDDDFRTSKRDKRTIKHASFVSKIEKNNQKTPKKRRASKKLAANLDSLADALPETDESQDPSTQANIIQQKTLKHKPGAMKRRQDLEKRERDRFARNMAQMSAMDTSAGTGAAAPGADAETDHNTAPQETRGTSNRWAALRSFISQTMEQQPVFKGNK